MINNYTPTARVEGRVAVAYVTYYGTAIPDPKYFTHLNYAFAELYVENGQYKGFKLQGNENRFSLISFIHLVSNPDNSQGGGFSALAKSDTYRKAFAADCKAFLIKWGIDGIDMDWEYPGLSWSGTGGYKFIDISAVDPFVDYVNIMTYNLSEAPEHQSALRDSHSYWDCERSVNAYLKAGVSANKLVLGIPFYGLHSFSESPQSISYKNILLLDPKIYKIDNWGESASVPFVTKNGVYFCGYDNAKSIALKGKWILGLGMKSLMFWSYDSDDAAGTLRKAVWEATMKK